VYFCDGVETCRLWGRASPNEAQGEHCSNGLLAVTSTLLGPRGEPLDAIPHELVLVRPLQHWLDLAQLSRILDRALWRSCEQYLQFGPNGASPLREAKAVH
jgi:hypothetical protein